jgi:hypothetical protein
MSWGLKIFLNDEQKDVFFDDQVALIVAIKILSTVLSSIYAGEIIEVKAFATEFLRVGLTLSVGIEFHKDAPVFTQNMVDIAHITGLVAIQPVVVTNATGVGAILFICATSDLGATFEAGSDFGRHKCIRNGFQ